VRSRSRIVCASSLSAAAASAVAGADEAAAAVAQHSIHIDTLIRSALTLGVP
jgi:hypothetical protein